MGFAPERRGERCIHVGSWYRYTGTSKDFWAKFLAFFLLTDASNLRKDCLILLETRKLPAFSTLTVCLASEKIDYRKYDGSVE
jgi:hypothetical protein